MLDIMIPVYEGSEKLSKAIQSVIQNTTVPYNLLVSVKKQSVAANRNDLLIMGRAPYVCFLDDDVEVPAGWAEELIATLDYRSVSGPINISGFEVAEPKVGMVGPRIVGPSGERQNASFDVQPGSVEVQYVCGAVMMWKRSEFPWLFADPMYVASQHEDADITYQMLARGYVPMVNGSVTVVHHNAMTGATGATQKMNESYFSSKWGGYLASRT